MTKINFTCETWGMEGIESEVNKAIDIINKVDWSKEDAKIIKKAFDEIEDLCEGLKESAWGDDS